MYHLQTFGGVALRDRDGFVIRLRSRKHLALLLFLVGNGRRVHTRRELAALFWDTPASRARHSLSQAVYDLRRRLDGILLESPGEEIRLDADRIGYDVEQLEEAVKAGDLGRAIELYRGPFAPNLDTTGADDFERWLEGERARLERLAQLTLRRYVQECDAQARWGEMCIAALRIIDTNPLDEEAHRALMRGLWLHGDRTSALRHYDEALGFLTRELPGGVSPETLALADRIRTAPPDAAPVRAGGDVRLPLVGRTAEFEKLKGAVRRLRGSEGGSLLVQGEGGIGKTRLIRELTWWLSLESTRLLESRCYAAETDIAYGPVVEALQPIVADLARDAPDECRRYTRLGHLFSELAPFLEPSLDHGLDASAWRRRLYDEMSDLLRSAVREVPIVWIVEDVHWIDATSRSLLHYLSRRLTDAPIVILMTERIERETAAYGAVRSDELLGDGPTKLVLGPLSDAEIDAVVTAACPEAKGHPAVDLARRLAGGNPFFALEVFRAAAASTEWIAEAGNWDPLTDARLSDVFAIRFRDIASDALRILQAVAVLERYATPRSVATLAGLSLPVAADLATALYDRGLLVDEGPCLGFANDIVRDYVYRQMSGLQRAAHHLTAAELLEQQPGVGAATLARHFHLGDDKPKTFQYAMPAAAEASEAGGHGEATVLACMAVEAARDLQQTLEALRLLAQAERFSAQLKLALQHYARILELDPEMPLSARIETKLHVVETMAGSADWNGACRALEDLSRDARLVTPQSSRLEVQFELLTWRLRAATRNNDCERAAALRRRVVRLRDAASKVARLTPCADVKALCAMAAYATFYESARDALSLLNQCKALEGAVAPSLAQRVHMLKGVTHLRLAEWDAAEYECKRALELVKPKNDALQVSPVLNNLACCALGRGDWAAAEELTDRVKHLHEALSVALDASLPIAVNAANAAFYRGEANKALSMYLRALQVAKENHLEEFLVELESCVGLTALQTGKRSLVEASWHVVEAWDEANLTGVQERFKVEWFRTFMLRSRRSQELRERLANLAADLEPFDLPGHLKVLWLRDLLLLHRDRGRQGLVGEKLTRFGLGWFAHFSQRWLGAASSYNWVGLI